MRTVASIESLSRLPTLWTTGLLAPMLADHQPSVQHTVLAADWVGAWTQVRKVHDDLLERWQDHALPKGWEDHMLGALTGLVATKHQAMAVPRG